MGTLYCPLRLCLRRGSGSPFYFIGVQWTLYQWRPYACLYTAAYILMFFMNSLVMWRLYYRAIPLVVFSGGKRHSSTGLWWVQWPLNSHTALLWCDGLIGTLVSPVCNFSVVCATHCQRLWSRSKYQCMLTWIMFIKSIYSLQERSDGEGPISR